MPDASSPEESARYILTVLLVHQWLGGHILAVDNFTLPLAKRGWKDDDFNRGIQYAIKKAWVEVPTPKFLELTDAGFAEACEIKTWPSWESTEGGDHQS
jgi:hypothetical protein